MHSYYPLDPGIVLRLHEAQIRAGDVQARGVMRAAVLRRWLEQAGLQDVRQQLFPEEQWAPLSTTEREGVAGMFQFFAAHAEQVAISEADRAIWQAQLDPAHPDCIIDRPDFYHRGGYVLAVGRVP